LKHESTVQNKKQAVNRKKYKNAIIKVLTQYKNWYKKKA